MASVESIVRFTRYRIPFADSLRLRCWCSQLPLAVSMGVDKNVALPQFLSTPSNSELQRKASANSQLQANDALATRTVFIRREAERFA